MSVWPSMLHATNLLWEWKRRTHTRRVRETTKYCQIQIKQEKKKKKQERCKESEMNKYILSSAWIWIHCMCRALILLKYFLRPGFQMDLSNRLTTNDTHTHIHGQKRVNERKRVSDRDQTKWKYTSNELSKTLNALQFLFEYIGFFHFLLLVLLLLFALLLYWLTALLLLAVFLLM